MTHPSTITTDLSQYPSKPKTEWEKMMHIAIFVCYFLGLIWVLLHPIISIMTGELKPRGLYVDENSLLFGNFEGTSYTHMKHQMMSIKKEFTWNLPTTTTTTTTTNTVGNHDYPSESKGHGLCSALHSIGFHRSECFHHQHFDVVKIVPLSSPTEPMEAVALIVSPPPPPPQQQQQQQSYGRNWIENEFHLSVLSLIERLADPIQSPWLAKSVFVISPTSNETNGDTLMQDTCISFLEAYLAHDFHPTKKQKTNTKAIPLPADFNSPLLRNVIVLDLQNNKDPSTSDTTMDIQVLPQGRRGVLPNLDLLTITMQSFTKWAARSKTVQLSFHPYETKANDLITRVQSKLPFRHWFSQQLQQTLDSYIQNLGTMIAFAVSLAIGPYPPHAPFLSHGIDSITVQFRNANNDASRPASMISLKTESLIRMLTSLHERLHHSVTQYLLPSTQTFVSNGEYIFSNVLFLLPLLFRAVLLFFEPTNIKDVKEHLRLTFMVYFMVACGVSLPLYGLQRVFTYENTDHYINHGSDDDDSYLARMNVEYIIIYVSTLFYCIFCIFCSESKTLQMTSVSTSTNISKTENNTHFLSTLLGMFESLFSAMALFMHAPIIMAHVSLIMPSLLFWVPIFTFPSSFAYIITGDGDNNKSVMWRQTGQVANLVMILTLVILWMISIPPFGIIQWFHGTYTPYLLWIYTPLHFFFAILIYLRLRLLFGMF